jgi:hypothetical protein
MWFEGKWMQLEEIMLSEVSQDQKQQKPHVFSHLWKTDPKINIHKNKHDHTQTQMQNVFMTVVLFYGTWGKRERKRE